MSQYAPDCHAPLSAQAHRLDPSTALLALLTITCIALPISPALGLVGGIAYALWVGNQAVQRTGRWAATLLKISVVGLGAGMNLGIVGQLMLHGAGYTSAGIAATLALGFWLSRRLGLGRDLGCLITVGTAICGGSAIGAVAAAIKPRGSDVTLALTIVFLLNAVALLVFPPIGHLLHFTPVEFGYWAALAIHDTSSVVGAAAAFDPNATAIATTVKLTRALWIMPVAVSIAWWWGRSEGSRERRRVPVPGFIIGFLIAAALFSYVPILGQWSEFVSGVARRCFAATLFLVGTGFSRASVREVGLRPLLAGVLLWLAVSIATAYAVHIGWLGLGRS